MKIKMLKNYKLMIFFENLSNGQNIRVLHIKNIQFFENFKNDIFIEI